MLDTKPNEETEPANAESGACIRINASEIKAKDHELLLLEAIDQTLADLLGRRAREAIYDHLERKCYMAREEMPQRLGEFCDILHANFGKAGTTIERAIAKRFYSRLEKRFIDYPGYGLVDYVEKASSQPSQRTIGLPITTTTVTTYVFPGQVGQA
ncbi:MAG: hypothetical protein ABSD99_05855 [Candidatus Bathyarchaeia archaeon]|jgi:hypothetical protein